MSPEKRQKTQDEKKTKALKPQHTSQILFPISFAHRNLGEGEPILPLSRLSPLKVPIPDKTRLSGPQKGEYGKERKKEKRIR